MSYHFLLTCALEAMASALLSILLSWYWKDSTHPCQVADDQICLVSHAAIKFITLENDMNEFQEDLNGSAEGDTWLRQVDTGHLKCNSPCKHLALTDGRSPFHSGNCFFGLEIFFIYIKHQMNSFAQEQRVYIQIFYNEKIDVYDTMQVPSKRIANI